MGHFNLESTGYGSITTKDQDSGIRNREKTLPEVPTFGRVAQGVVLPV